MSVTQSTSAVGELVPLLFVEDAGRSAAFYRDKLGFELTGSWEPEGKLSWCRMRRGGGVLMLQQACPEEDGPAAGRGRGVEFFFTCDDADTVYAELSANGVTVDPPKVAFYGMKQLFLKDPDGYALCFQNPVEQV
jgi:glyoxylase I family protein